MSISFTPAPAPERGRSPPTSLADWEQLGRSVVQRRMDRLSLLRNNRTFSINSNPQHLDASLVKERQALDEAWSRELSALIEMKRAPTLDAIATAEAARADTGRVVARIEMARALTFDGLKVKARAALWRRHGEPLPPGSLHFFAQANSEIGYFVP